MSICCSQKRKSLRYRPRKLVKHCLKKISLTNSADLPAIIFTKNGIFSVKSSNESQRSMVSFGNEMNIPKCTCLDWGSSCYPCKYFLISFANFMYASGMLYHRCTLIHFLQHYIISIRTIFVTILSMSKIKKIFEDGNNMNYDRESSIGMSHYPAENAKFAA